MVQNIESLTDFESFAQDYVLTKEFRYRGFDVRVRAGIDNENDKLYRVVELTVSNSDFGISQTFNDRERLRPKRILSYLYNRLARLLHLRTPADRNVESQIQNLLEDAVEFVDSHLENAGIESSGNADDVARGGNPTGGSSGNSSQSSEQ